MVKLIYDIREGMRTVLKTSDFMYDDERAAMHAKLDNITFLVGFPDWYKNTTAIVNSFRGVYDSYFLIK